MIAKLKICISFAVSLLQVEFFDSTKTLSQRRTKRRVLPFLLALALMAAQPLAAQEQVTIDPAGVVSWDELLKFQQTRIAPYVTKPKVVPFMPGPEPRSLDEAVDAIPPTAPSMEDFVGEGGEPLVEIEDDFEALPDNNTSIPPDTMGAAGPNHLMTMLNTEVRIQDKSGNNLSTVTLDTFWTMGTGLTGNPFDPKVIFDQLSGRWLATVDADSASPTSAVWFAVSTTNDPTGTWTFYAIDADAGNTTWADYPGFGVNSKWVAITNNMFTFAGSFVGAKMWVINKSTFGGALGVTVFPTGFDLAGGADGFTLKPAVTFNQTGVCAQYLYIVDNSGFFRTSDGIHLLRVSRITGSPASPSWEVVPDGAGVSPGTGFFLVANDFNFIQIDASQPGTATRVETNDPRLLNAVCRNGHLWTTHSAGLPRTGTANRTAVFWYELNPALQNTTGDPIVQSGVLDGGADVHHFFPSIAANSTDDVALGFSRSGPSTFVEGVLTGRSSGDPAGSMDPIQVIKAGEDSYVKDFGSGRVRWGDYSATVVDPADDSTFWSLQQYAAMDVGAGSNDDRWGTWWARLTSEEVTPFALTVAVDPSGAGTVNGTGIACPNDCSEMYAEDAQVTLTATENRGFQFASWSGCDSPNGNQCTMTMDANKTVTATFFDDIDRGPHPVSIQSSIKAKKIKGAKDKTTDSGTITFNQSSENGGNFVIVVNGRSFTGILSFLRKKGEIKKLNLTFDQTGLNAIEKMLEDWIVELTEDAGGTLTNTNVEIPDVLIKNWKFSSENKSPKGKTKGKALGSVEGTYNGEPKEAPLKWKFKMAII